MFKETVKNEFFLLKYEFLIMRVSLVVFYGLRLSKRGKDVGVIRFICCFGFYTHTLNYVKLQYKMQKNVVSCILYGVLKRED